MESEPRKHQTVTSGGIGAAVRRKEDARLVRGAGAFTDDISLPGQVYAAFARSPHAHARILAIDAGAARASADVLAVLTGADLLADGVRPLPHHVWALHPADIAINSDDGSPTFTAPHHAMTADKARHAGEIVAMAVAASSAAARDAVERIKIEYEILPSVTDTRAAAAPGAPRVWDAHANACADAHVGDRDATEAAFAQAAHIVELDTWVQRVTGVPMEPRAALCEFDAASGRYAFYAGSGGSVRLKHDLAHMLGAEAESVRVIMRDVGGNFGTRGMIYPEFCLVAWAARRVGRPVKWLCERSEAFLSDYQARDLAVTAQLALDKDGRFLAMRGSNIGNAGAHTSNFSPLQKGVEIMTSIYRIPHACFRVRPVVSNTVPTRPYRSAGRPEVMFVMERLIDLAAVQCGFDRVELRRANLLRSDELPYRNPFGMVFDNGDYVSTMNSVLTLGDWRAFPARRAAAKARGKLRGIGVANYVDTATGVPRERAEITARADGVVDVVIGTISNGQGHETSFAQLAVEFLGVSIDKVNIITGDTDIVFFGGGTHSGRGMRLASIVISKACAQILDKGKRVAAPLLQAPLEKIEYRDGRFFSPDGASVNLAEAAKAADDAREPLRAVSDETVNDASFPYGSHVCEVEIDPETGVVQIIKYSTVDDVGVAVNPMIIHGQTHGGIAQGAGQALMEHCHYDPASGQLLSGSFMDYAMPRANSFPFFDAQFSECPDTAHPLGIRPAGEGGTTPALAVVTNAIVDALSEHGVRHIEMPVTSQKIWRALRRNNR